MFETYDIYHGYKVMVEGKQVFVFDPRFPRDKALFKTTSICEAMRWVDGYRNGEQWALAAAYEAEVQ